LGSLTVLLGACSAGLAGLAVLTRADSAIRRALAPLVEDRSHRRIAWSDGLARLGRTRWIGGSGGALQRRLDQAGSPWPLDVLLGLKLVLPACGAAACLALAMLFPAAAMVSLPLGAAAFRCPDFVVARMAKHRRARIAAQVPDLGELLLAMTQAGLPPPVAFRRAAEAVEGELGAELDVALRQVDLGVPWRSAMDEMATSVEDASLRRLVSALGRTQRLGTSVAGALRTVTEDLRGERRARAEELARRAPVKMLFPLVFLILPAFLLLTVGPVVLATIRSLR
jgi:tight adherence protein C